MSLQPLSAFSDNYIWALSGADGGAVVVDPGEAAPVLAAAGRGLRPALVLLTHHHNDPIGGCAELLRHWPALPVFAPDDELVDLPFPRPGDCQQVGHRSSPFQVSAH